jgi:hypothetical protein
MVASNTTDDEDEENPENEDPFGGAYPHMDIFHVDPNGSNNDEQCMKTI